MILQSQVQHQKEALAIYCTLNTFGSSNFSDVAFTSFFFLLSQILNVFDVHAQLPLKSAFLMTMPKASVVSDCIAGMLMQHVKEDKLRDILCTQTMSPRIFC